MGLRGNQRTSLSRVNRNKGKSASRSPACGSTSRLATSAQPAARTQFGRPGASPAKPLAEQNTIILCATDKTTGARHPKVRIFVEILSYVSYPALYYGTQIHTHPNP